MARNYRYKCAKAGHEREEGWTDVPQARPDGRLFLSWVCVHCRCLVVNLLPFEAKSPLVGAGGETLLIRSNDED